MKTRFLVATAVLSALTACGGGEVNLNVATVDNSVDNSTGNGGGSSNPCASYTVSGSNAVRQGQFDGRNCVYGSSFVGLANPLAQDVTIPFISGVHIFQDSLVVGTNVSTGVAPAGGTGPKLTIASGNTLAFSDSADYVLVNRGAQIIANGSPAAPITFTSFSDAVSNNAGADDVSQWGGIVLNGNGITNNCTDTQRQNNQCHVTSEGQPSNYGGNDNTDNSGTLRYVVVKHTGFEVAPGDELNGITFNAVGSGTTIENVQVYSTFDDGFEFFGGAVNPKNLIALYARDDSLDFSDGYVGTIENALIIHWRNNGNRCIELDNIGEGRSTQGAPLDTAPLTQATVRNMTCITSNTDVNTHGDSEGPLARQGGQLKLENSIVWSGYGLAVNGVNSNECYEIESGTSLAFAASGGSTVVNSIIGCAEAVKGSLANGDTLAAWVTNSGTAAYAFNSGNTLITTPAAAGVSVMAASPLYATAATLTGPGGAAITLPAGTRVGAVAANDDWTAPWAFGLRTQNADQPLWFVP